ncbi:MAG: hypothetical protein ABH829_03965 [archaeon]
MGSMRALEMTIKTIAVIIAALVCAFLILRFFTSQLDWATDKTDATTPDTSQDIGFTGIYGVLGACKAKEGETVVWRCVQPPPFDSEDCGVPYAFASKHECTYGIASGGTTTQEGCRYITSDYDKDCFCKCSSE